MYAIIEDSGKEFKVSKGEIIDVDQKDIKVGEPVTFDRVKLLHDGEKLHTSPEKAVVS